jgi:predicted component of viral defense system (DUF524 family)
MVFLPGTWRSGVPQEISDNVEEETGPPFFEETAYHVFLECSAACRVQLINRDPLIGKHIKEEKEGSLLHGRINFRSQIGLCNFTVVIDGTPEFEFTVEVFPTKIDYEIDYWQMLADVQEILTGLALEYLRSTYQTGFELKVPSPTQLEWLILLQFVLDDLQKALEQIAIRPIRAVIRYPQSVLAEKVKRVDSAVRSAVLRGAGYGPYRKMKIGVQVRQRLIERKARTTLDTPEHRWLALQLRTILRSVEEIRRHQITQPENIRNNKIIEELSKFESRIARLSRLEPFLESAMNLPPPGFASLQLLNAPGYYEAYKSCLILSLGLRIEGGPLKLSVKDIHLLYEYWCYLALLRLLKDITDQPIPVEEILSIKKEGIRVLLEKGRKQEVSFRLPTGRRIKAVYSPSFKGDPILVPQKPDMLVSFEDPQWPDLHFLLDAKYRVDNSERYIEQYRAPGPPEDAVNVLHRYRDAILESGQDPSSSVKPKRIVVQAAALFPYREVEEDAYKQSRMWRSIEKVGIGALPFLPGETKYLHKWFKNALQQGGWTLSDKVIRHTSTEYVQELLVAASETVLIGTLIGSSPREHLEWIGRERKYFIPYYPTQGRQFATKWIGIYTPASIRGSGAVTHIGRVTVISVINYNERLKLNTPWQSRQQREQYVLYKIDKLKELSKKIESKNNTEHKYGIQTHMWTSRLALERARDLKELSLGSSAEWQLYEDLKASQLEFIIEAGEISAIGKRHEVRHAKFVINGNVVIQYAEASGFRIKWLDGRVKYMARSKDAVKCLCAG